MPLSFTVARMTAAIWGSRMSLRASGLRRLVYLRCKVNGRLFLPLSPLKEMSAFAVHILTAAGAALALAALMSAVAAQWTAMFGYLGLALIIDGLDGTLPLPVRAGHICGGWCAPPPPRARARAPAALVGRRARSDRRFRHLRVRSRVRD